MSHKNKNICCQYLTIITFESKILLVIIIKNERKVFYENTQKNDFIYVSAYAGTWTYAW